VAEDAAFVHRSGGRAYFRFFTEYGERCGLQEQERVELLQHPADRSVWLSAFRWATMRPRPRGHRSFTRRALRRAGAFLLEVRRIPPSSPIGACLPRCCRQSADLAPQPQQPRARPSGGLTSKGWMPTWSNGVAGHWESDSHRERSPGCWSSSTRSCSCNRRTDGLLKQNHSPDPATAGTIPKFS
jgi:hypothetical protein